MNSFLPEQLTTPRLRLRRPTVADASAIFQSYAQDPEVCRFMVWKPHESEAETAAFMTACVEAWKTGRQLPYVITEQASDLPIGMIEARTLGTSMDIGYVLSRSHWGSGLMPEAILALAGAALKTPGVFRVQATCDVENLLSQRALEKAGFKREGCLARYTVHPNLSLEPRACWMYAKCR
jgi:[ribosomal protein S5]-alanine N-acetyltransferase